MNDPENRATGLNSMKQNSRGRGAVEPKQSKNRGIEAIQIKAYKIATKPRLNPIIKTHIQNRTITEKPINPSLLIRETKQSKGERESNFSEPNELYRSAKHSENAIKMSSGDRGARIVDPILI